MRVTLLSSPTVFTVYAFLFLNSLFSCRNLTSLTDSHQKKKLVPPKMVILCI